MSAFGNTKVVELEDGRILVTQGSKLIERWADRLIETVSLVENRNVHLGQITFYNPTKDQLQTGLVQGENLIVPINENFLGCIYHYCLQKNNSDCISITGRLVMSPFCHGYISEQYVFFLDKNSLIVNRDYSYEPSP